jgi:transcriptional regulator with PAS, ATPase and Fis domain
MVAAGEFRQDLYYRINVFPIYMPPLSERLEDLPLIARSILQEQGGDKSYHLTESAVQLLKDHHYRGNIRELRNILARSVVLTNTNVIDQSVVLRALQTGLSEAAPRASAEDGAGDMSLKESELQYLRQLMRRYRNDREKVAAIAGISVRSLYRKLQAKGEGG